MDHGGPPAPSRPFLAGAPRTAPTPPRAPQPGPARHLDRFAADAKRRVAAGYYAAAVADGDARPNGSLARAITDMAPQALLAEVKRRSPSSPMPRATSISASTVGSVSSVAPSHPARTVAELAAAYAAGGACGISALTDPDHFEGSLDDLAACVGTGRPVLMKDFTVATAQLDAAAARGASAVLAIVTLHDRRLADMDLPRLVKEAHDRGLEVVAEARTLHELATASRSHADILAINARNLDTLAMEPDRCEAVLRTFEDTRPTLWLSGIHTREDVLRARSAGADGVLVGIHLVDAADPAAEIKLLLGRVPR